MANNQIPVPDLNRIIDELMSEHRQGVEEVHLEPPTKTVMNAEPKTQLELEELVEVAYFGNMNSKLFNASLGKRSNFPKVSSFSPKSPIGNSLECFDHDSFT